MPCVARWRDEVYVGTLGERGLCKLEGGALRSLKPKIQALALDVRQGLVATMSGAIVGTYDGVSFKGSPIRVFASITASSPPMW
jgi:hypothetical protein